MKLFIFLLAIYLNSFSTAESTGSSRCERITLPMCSAIGYNTTLFPNLLNHKTQAAARLELQSFMSTIKYGCSPSLKLFLCSLFVPMCSEVNEPFPPCRHLCEQALLGCEEEIDSVVQKFGQYSYKWREKLNCNQYPEQGLGTLCFGPDKIPQQPFEKPGCKKNIGFTCPNYMEVPSTYNLDYSFMGVGNCSAPCDNDKLLFWGKDKRTFANAWVGCWSFLCLISTLFTVLTYLIDMPRFLYPERPIIFLSGCYMMVSIAYIAGFFLRDTVACQQFQSDRCGFDGDSCPKVVTQGTREAGCTILFMVVYFFSMASSIWWVMLTVTWLLAAGLKWGQEAIEQKSPYFHAAAWSIPALQTVAVLISSKIEGDILSGVCFVGIYSTSHLLWTLLIPLSLYLLVGTSCLVAGFVYLFNIRNVVKNEVGTNRVEKLEKLMVKIGIFSLLYTVPATVTIGCYFYELINRESWSKGWLIRNCQKDRVPCPCEFEDEVDSEPDFIVFIVKYFMTLIVGITSGFWIWSSKTVESWIIFRDRLCCKTQSRPINYSRGTAPDYDQPINALYVKEPSGRQHFQQNL